VGRIERILPKEANRAWDFVNHFKKSNNRSVDLFVAQNPGFTEIGRKAIALSIYEKEWSSSSGDQVSGSEDWYSYLFHRMAEDIMVGPGSFQAFSDSPATFITFNYDRSLENFLWQSLSNCFSYAKREDIKDQLDRVEIHHVYGSIDKLPWQRGRRNYGAGFPLRSIDDLTKDIKLPYDPDVNHTSDYFQKNIQDARHVYFLGFGYAQENLEALGIPAVLSHKPAVYGTALGLFDSEIDRVKNRLNPSGNSITLNLEKCNCKELLGKYLYEN
jgi:hypothetical protein